MHFLKLKCFFCWMPKWEFYWTYASNSFKVVGPWETFFFLNEEFKVDFSQSGVHAGTQRKLSWKEYCDVRESDRDRLLGRAAMLTNVISPSRVSVWRTSWLIRQISESDDFRKEEFTVDRFWEARDVDGSCRNCSPCNFPDPSGVNSEWNVRRGLCSKKEGKSSNFPEWLPLIFSVIKSRLRISFPLREKHWSRRMAFRWRSLFRDGPSD